MTEYTKKNKTLNGNETTTINTPNRKQKSTSLNYILSNAHQAFHPSSRLSCITQLDVMNLSRGACVCSQPTPTSPSRPLFTASAPGRHSPLHTRGQQYTAPFPWFPLAAVQPCKKPNAGGNFKGTLNHLQPRGLCGLTPHCTLGNLSRLLADGRTAGTRRLHNRHSLALIIH